MTETITRELVEAYSLCPRKAFLLMTDSAASPGPHEYEQFIRSQAAASRQAHRVGLSEAGEVVAFASPTDLAAGKDVLADADLAASGLQLHCDFLTKVDGPSRLGKFCYEPVMAVGTRCASKTDALGLAYAGVVLGEVQGGQPAEGPDAAEAAGADRLPLRSLRPQDP